MKIFYFVGHSNPNSNVHVERIEHKLITKMVKEKGWTVDAHRTPSPGLPELISHNYETGKIDWRYACEWEKDPIKCDEVTRRMADLELSLGISLSRCFYAERHFNRMITKKSFLQPTARLWKYCKLKQDNPRKIIQRYFVVFNELLDDSKPDAAIIHSYAGAGNLLFAFICQHRNIPFFNPQETSIFVEKTRFNTHYFFHDNKDLDNVYLSKIENNILPSARALKYIEDNRTLSQHFSEWEKARDTKRIKAMYPREILKRTCRDTIGFIKLMIKKSLGLDKNIYNKPLFLRRDWFWLKLYFRYQKRLALFKDFNEDELSLTDYIYFPLHQDPEQQLTTENPVWGEALTVIEMLTKMIPLHYRLYVRDHMDNIGMRPTGFYKHLLSLPGVTLLNPTGNSTKFIKHANLIITLNGTSGWEGLLMERPVITLNKAFYDTTGLTYKIDDINNIDYTILEILRNHKIKDKSAYYKKLALLVDTADEIGFKSDDEAVDDCIKRIEEAVAKRKQQIN